MTIVGIVLGIFFGFSASVFIVMRDIKKSNDQGDSRASYSDFCAEGKPNITATNDRVPREIYMDALLKARAAQNGKLKR